MAAPAPGLSQAVSAPVVPAGRSPGTSGLPMAARSRRFADELQRQRTHSTPTDACAPPSAEASEAQRGTEAAPARLFRDQLLWRGGLCVAAVDLGGALGSMQAGPEAAGACPVPAPPCQTRSSFDQLRGEAVASRPEFHADHPLPLQQLLDRLVEAIDLAPGRKGRSWRLSIQLRAALLSGTGFQVESQGHRLDIGFAPGSQQAEDLLVAAAPAWRRQLTARFQKPVFVRVGSAGDVPAREQQAPGL